MKGITVSNETLRRIWEETITGDFAGFNAREELLERLYKQRKADGVEDVEVGVFKDPRGGVVRYCSKCLTDLAETYHYCPECGRFLMW